MNPFISDMLQKYKNVPVSEIDKLREILQQLALFGLYRAKFFDHAAFYGDTALRILFGLNRFSEDLDFSLLTQDPQFDFTPFLERLEQEMESLGFKVSVTEKKKTAATGILSAFLKANTLDLLLTIQEKGTRIHPDQKLNIKLEIDTDPPLQFRTQSLFVHEPAPFHVVTYHLSDLFAGKMHAILYRSWQNRVKGRDWFDLIWFIQKKVPLGLKHLNERIRHIKSGEPFTKAELLHTLEERIKTIDWELAKRDVRGFLSDARVLEGWSTEFFLDLIRHLQVEI